jgi:hypothetical protein
MPHVINLGAVWRRSKDGRNVNGLSREEGERSGPVVNGGVVADEARRAGPKPSSSLAPEG